MSGEIKRIDSIKNVAVFKDFHWAASVRDEGNNIAELKKSIFCMAATIPVRQHFHEY